MRKNKLSPKVNRTGLVPGLGTVKKIMTGRKLGERRIKKNIAFYPWVFQREPDGIGRREVGRPLQGVASPKSRAS